MRKKKYREADDLKNKKGKRRENWRKKLEVNQLAPRG